jgi:hypothetical protein
MTVKKKVCEFCGEKVDLKKQKAVSLITHIPTEEDQTSYFHFGCFKKNHEEKVKKKAERIVKNMQKQAQGMLQNVMGSFQGSEGLNSMLNPLGQNKFQIPSDEDLMKNPFDQINKTKKDGKPKRKRKQKT